jgi:hypothetical protein
MNKIGSSSTEILPFILTRNHFGNPVDSTRLGYAIRV